MLKDPLKNISKISEKTLKKRWKQDVLIEISLASSQTRQIFRLDESFIGKYKGRINGQLFCLYIDNQLNTNL
jgi:hypothetical protein